MADKDDNGKEPSELFPNKVIEPPPPVDRDTSPSKILQFENLISGFSAALIDAPAEVLEKELGDWLSKFVDFLNVDRCCVIEYSYDRKTIHMLLNYIIPEVDSVSVVTNYQPAEGVIEELEKGKIIKAEKIPDDLPQTFRGGIIEKDKTKSTIIVPLSIGNKMIGSMSFSSYRKECKWPDDVVRRIKLVSEVITNAILRIRTHKALLDEMDRRQKLEERYSSIIKTANVGFMISDLNGKIIDVNDSYCKMSGYNRNELLDMTISQLDISLDEGKVENDLKGIYETGSFHHETSHIKKDGTIINVLISANLLEKEGIVFSFIRDITKLNRAQKEHMERLKFEEIFSEFSAALINIELDDLNEELKKWAIKFVDFLEIGRCVINEYQFNKNTIKLLVSYTDPASAAYTTPHDMDLKAPDIVMDEFRKGTAIRAEKIPEDLQAPFHGWIIEKHNTKSLVVVPLIAGHQVIGNLTLASYRKERKWPDYIFDRIKLIGVIIANAILRKRSSDALLAEMEHRQLLEEKYTSIIKNANVGFWIADLDSRILEVNDAYCMMSGYSRDELLDMTIDQIDRSLSPEYKSTETDRLLEKGGFHIESSHTKKDGTIIEVAINSSFLEKEEVFFTFIRDITELNKARRDLEDRLNFEELISHFSAALVNVKPDGINDELNHWVKKFVEFLRVDRGIFHEYDYDSQAINVLVSYTDPDVDVITSPLLESHIAPDAIWKEFVKGTVIRAQKIPEDLPPLFQGGILERLHTKSIVIVPLSSEDQVIGNLTFVNYKIEHEWHDEFIRRIKLIGEIVAHAILRIRSHKALVKETERRRRIEERYTSVLKNANVGFFIADYENNILDVNDEYCKWSGYSRDELLSMKIHDLQLSMPSDDIKRVSDELANTGATHHEATHKKKDGSILELYVSSTVLDENIFFSFMRDITELNRTRREREERLRFEEVISEFSTALINIQPDDIERELEKWLKRFVELLDVDRCAINEYLDDQRIIKNLMLYSVPGINISIPSVRNTPEGEISELEKGIIKVEKTHKDMPKMFHERFIEGSEPKSLIIVPLLTGNRVFGNLAFTTFTKERKWSDELIRRIKLISEIVGNAILRQHSHEALLEEMKSRHLLEEKYTSIIKNASVGFVISDRNQNILDVNDEYCRMSGYSYDELTKMRIADIVFSEDPEKKVEDNIALAIESENGLYHHLTRHIHKSGRIFDVEVHSQYSESEGFFFSFVRDITELNKARRELEERLKFEEFASQLSTALINVKLDDISKEINHWLERFAKLLNVDRCIISEYQDDFAKLNFLFSYTNPDVEAEIRPLPSGSIATYGYHVYLERDEIIKYESPQETFPEDIRQGLLESVKDGTKSLLIVPLKAGDMLLGVMSVSTVISERTWTQDLIRRLKLIAEIFSNALMRDRTDLELESYRKDLEELVDERTARLEETQQELVLSEKMATLGRLTATVSHELRNPLGTIRSSLFSVNRRLKGQDERTGKALERAERSIQRCDIIIEELLDYSRAQTLILRQTNIDHWLTELFEEEKPPEGIFLEKELNAGLSIEIDPERFRRCMINILTNAYQSIHEKSDKLNPGCVRVMTKRDESGIKIEISDNGNGFDQKDIGKIFEPLYSTKTFGVGLGLPITKQIVEMHGWNMDMRGELGKGALVTISIPIS